MSPCESGAEKLAVRPVGPCSPPGPVLSAHGRLPKLWSVRLTLQPRRARQGYPRAVHTLQAWVGSSHAWALLCGGGRYGAGRLEVAPVPLVVSVGFFFRGPCRSKLGPLSGGGAARGPGGTSAPSGARGGRGPDRCAAQDGWSCSSAHRLEEEASGPSAQAPSAALSLLTGVRDACLVASALLYTRPSVSDTYPQSDHGQREGSGERPARADF